MNTDELKLPGLLGKVAVVTGASRGIGYAIARELARHGTDLILVARDADALASVAKEIEALGRKAIIVPGDLSAADYPARVAGIAQKTFSRVDILVNNAGATKRGNFLELSDTDWDDGFGLKLFGAVRMCRTFWPHLKATKGAVVNIAGAGGRTPDKPFTIGGSVNAAMMAFTKALADFGREDSVRVNLLNPGLIRTDRLEKRVLNVMNSEGIDRLSAEARLATESGITRIGEATEIAAIVAFIVSDSGSLFHGALIDADAGYTKGL
jgi:NAD(P)-dependent dehydrogenase (short-subunit alcohol dehydrogenase family)